MIPVTSTPDINPDPTVRHTPPVESESPAVDNDVPANMVELKEGAKVIAKDNKQVGNVERLLIDQNTDRVTHFVLSRGLLLRESKLVPAYWLTDVSDHEVHIAVDSGYLHKLPDYHS
jgi:sporulation protein YlmC with PRC-barrel domain